MNKDSTRYAPARLQNIVKTRFTQQQCDLIAERIIQLVSDGLHLVLRGRIGAAGYKYVALVQRRVTLTDQTARLSSQKAKLSRLLARLDQNH